MSEEKLSDLKIALIVAHSMNRLLMHFSHKIVNGKPERNNNFNVVLSRINKFLRKRERTNKTDFVFATEFERIFWLNVTDSYTKETPIFAINIVSIFYDYFPELLKKYVGLNENIMMKLAGIHTRTKWDKKQMYEIEQIDDSFSSSYIKMLYPYSGVELRKSLFAGKLLTIKNNLIVEGKKVKEGF